MWWIFGAIALIWVGILWASPNNVREDAEIPRKKKTK